MAIGLELPMVKYIAYSVIRHINNINGNNTKTLPCLWILLVACAGMQAWLNVHTRVEIYHSLDIKKTIHWSCSFCYQGKKDIFCFNYSVKGNALVCECGDVKK